MLAAYAAGETAEVLEAGFNQVHQTLLDPAVEPRCRSPTSSWCCGGSRTSSAQSLVDWVVESGDPTALIEDVRQLGLLVRQAASSTGIPVLVTTPPVPVLPWLDQLDTRSSVRLTVLHGRLVEAFLDGLGDAPVTLVDLDALVRSHGVQQAYDTRNDLMYRQPFSSAFTKALGQPAR